MSVLLSTQLTDPHSVQRQGDSGRRERERRQIWHTLFCSVINKNMHQGAGKHGVCKDFLFRMSQICVYGYAYEYVGYICGPHICISISRCFSPLSAAPPAHYFCTMSMPVGLLSLLN